MVKTVHITNGDGFSERLKHLDISGTILTWREILCEGPVPTSIFSPEFIQNRKSFLNDNYGNQNSIYNEFVAQFDIFLNNSIEQIVLWFEYDLFCQVNLAAVLSYLKQQNIELPIFLVCSGSIDDSSRLYGLNELSDEQLNQQYNARLTLNLTDIESYIHFWNIYTSNSHIAMADLEVDKSRLPYLNSSIDAHLKRFPEMRTGLNQLELDLLKLIDKSTFKTKKHLLGYILQHQGYYGFGDSQWQLIIEKINSFFNSENQLILSLRAKEIINGERNVFDEMKDQTQFGGSLKYDYLYDIPTNSIRKG